MNSTLFDPIPAYQPHSLTSVDAALSMAGKTKTLRDLVFDALKKSSMTDEQISEALNIAPNTARPRRIELVRMGVVKEVGKSVTKSGRLAIVWGVD